MQLCVRQVSVAYGSQRVVNQFNFELSKGEIGCLIGPSGCGKTTLQRAIAGFQNIDAGEIVLAGKTVSRAGLSVAPEARKVGMVFQDFALFPHLTVAQNIAFGISHKSKKDAKTRLDELLQLIDLPHYHDQFPHELSGGQQQRVALARAIAPKPDILLLDEPFSSLDSTLRAFIAKEVRKLLKEYNITAILVTHDQHEAFAFADKVGVMNQGTLLQWDTPYNLYHKPHCREVANFIGEGTLIKGVVNGQGELDTSLGKIISSKPLQAGKSVDVLVRPDDVVYDLQSSVTYEIKDKMFKGAEYLYQLAISADEYVLCVTPSHINLQVGERLPVSTDLKHLIVFDD